MPCLREERKLTGVESLPASMHLQTMLPSSKQKTVPRVSKERFRLYRTVHFLKEKIDIDIFSIVNFIN